MLPCGPGLTKTESCEPWNPPSNLRIFFLPVNPLASLRACIVASVPELTSRTICMEGTSDEIVSASSTSASVGCP